MDSVSLKIQAQGALRKVSLPKKQVSFEELRKMISTMTGIQGGFQMQYTDEEGDVITLGSDAELVELLAVAEKTGKMARLNVIEEGSASQQPPTSNEEPPLKKQQEEEEEPQQEEPPEVPFAALARALSDPVVVGKLQDVFTSPIITEGVNQAAKAYVDSNGDVEPAMAILAQQAPLFLALVSEVVEEVPELSDVKELLKSLLPMFSGGMPPFALLPMLFGGAGLFGGAMPEGPCGPRGGRCGPRGGRCGGGPNRHQRHHHQQQHQQQQQRQQGRKPHFGVFCDGCILAPELKEKSIAAGTTGRRGMILGLRFKSNTIHDFDLCETCKESGKYPDEAYGPFTQLEPRGCGPRGGGGGGCGAWWRAHHQQGQQQGPWRRQGEEAAPKESEAASASTATTEDQLAAAVKEALNLVEQEVAAPPPVQEAEKVTTTKDEWVPVAPPAPEDPFVKWRPQLEQLATLGFVKSETYVELLEEENGDLDKVVNRIVRRDLS